MQRQALQLIATVYRNSTIQISLYTCTHYNYTQLSHKDLWRVNNPDDDIIAVVATATPELKVEIIKQGPLLFFIWSHFLVANYSFVQNLNQSFWQESLNIEVEFLDS